MKMIMRALPILISIMIVAVSSCQEEKEKDTRVLISTDYGDIIVKLYDDTPLHKENFLTLVNEGWYDGSIFHRVIGNFMIQGGWNAQGEQDPGYRINAEFVPEHIHKKGALAAARQGDHVNPEKKSSGCQFYIVQGQVWNDEMLDQLSQRMQQPISEERRAVYKTIGGAPHLDDEYTVFGEVVEGLEVIDKIAVVQTGKGDRPLEDVKMTMKVLE